MKDDKIKDQEENEDINNKDIEKTLDELLKELDSKIDEINEKNKDESIKDEANLSEEERKKREKETKKKTKKALKEMSQTIEKVILENLQPKITPLEYLIIYVIRILIDLSIFIILNSFLKPISADFWYFIIIPLIYSILTILGRIVTRKIGGISMLKQILLSFLTSLVSYTIVILLFYELHLIKIVSIGLLGLIFIVMYIICYYVMSKITPLIIKKKRKEKPKNE